MPTVLLDLHDELLIRCLSGAGGLGIRAASVTCTRLYAIGKKLKRLPVFSSALSTHDSLQHAITDAAQRALTGTFGAVDFALLFVANDETRATRETEERSDDVEHAVEMLQEVVGQDVVVVGCACSGLMGVGPDNQPMEVDPHRATDFAKKAAAAREQQGLPPLPTKGVSVLLGKLPPGSVARAFALEESSHTENCWYRRPGKAWPLLNEALELTDKQHAAMQRTWPCTSPAAAVGKKGITEYLKSLELGTAAQWHQARQRSAEAGAAASATRTYAAAEGSLPSVSAAGFQDLLSVGSGHRLQELVALHPAMCLMFYDAPLHDPEDYSMRSALHSMALERCTTVVGGVSSGAGDLFYSPGAQGSRVHQNSPSDVKAVGLLLCNTRVIHQLVEADETTAAETPAAAAAAAAGGPSNASDTPQPPAAAGPEATTPLAPPSPASLRKQATTKVASKAALVGGKISPKRPLVMYHKSAVQAAGFGSAGFGPMEGDCQDCSSDPPNPLMAPFTEVKFGILEEISTFGPVGTSGNWFDVVILIKGCSFPHNPANADTPPEEQQAAALKLLGKALGCEPQSDEESDEESDEQGSDKPDKSPDDKCDDKHDSPYLALWVDPNATRFTGLERQMAFCEVVHCTWMDGGAGLEVSLLCSNFNSYMLRQLLLLKKVLGCAHPLRAQVVRRSGTPAAAMMRHGVKEVLRETEQSHTPLEAALVVQALGAEPPTGGAAQPDQAAAAEGSCADTGGEAGSTCALGSLQDCHDALALTAWEAGARSGPNGLCVCSSVSRGQSLMCDPQHPESYGELTEAGTVDDVCGRRVPFVGVYVDGELGPDMENSCVGWTWRLSSTKDLPKGEMTSNTSMIAGWGCQPDWYD